MTDEEVIDLLSVITAYDKRSTGQSELLAWADAARRGRWTLAEATDAVKAHYAEETSWLMPGHVTRRIKEARSEPPRSGALPTATPRPASDEHRDRVVDWLAERVHVDRDERTAENRRCQDVPCPHCGADRNRPCVQTIGPFGKRRAGDLPIDRPHGQRKTAYREEQQ